MPEYLEATVKGQAQDIAMARGNHIDKYKPDPKELVEYSPEIANYIVRQIAKGRSLLDVCKAEDMPHHVTFLKWCYAQPELAEEYSKAKKFRAHSRIEGVESVIDTLDPYTSSKNEAYIADIKAKNMVRLAELGDPASFSPKMQMMHQHSGSVVAITMDLSAPQSRQPIDITPSQVSETPNNDAPQLGTENKKDEGGGGL
jgi:hypothetical protein